MQCPKCGTEMYYGFINYECSNCNVHADMEAPDWFTFYDEDGDEFDPTDEPYYDGTYNIDDEESYESIYEDIPEGCRACGSDMYPNCKDSCNMFDD